MQMNEWPIHQSVFFQDQTSSHGKVRNILERPPHIIPFVLCGIKEAVLYCFRGAQHDEMMKIFAMIYKRSNDLRRGYAAAAKGWQGRELLRLDASFAYWSWLF